MDNGRKLRLSVDLRYVNSFLKVPSFRVDDFQTLAELFQQGDFSGNLRHGPHRTESLGRMWSNLQLFLCWDGVLD